MTVIGSSPNTSGPTNITAIGIHTAHHAQRSRARYGTMSTTSVKRFRAAKIRNMTRSSSDRAKVANFSIDLPEASVAIQVSGSFGSRQEESQRLGRLLRPKESGHTASFYTLIARDTVDQDFAQNRQRFLAEQGYSYTILDADRIAA